jgi:hypothetical protein
LDSMPSIGIHFFQWDSMFSIKYCVFNGIQCFPLGSMFSARFQCLLRSIFCNWIQCFPWGFNVFHLDSMLSFDVFYWNPRFSIKIPCILLGINVFYMKLMHPNEIQRT